ncbi:sulfotransferase [Planktosalinus lacus]|uniref:Sulfotransferase family protein n=1 Tax=Planktosalinus lacus TaxID=1526573 RepID=A0A8J2Y856_9FLAO|nr:sulfotransferase [Planktosalinus lacus]GGD84797.1 sulfotransferase family protein [Planktosalinus lacus]
MKGKNILITGATRSGSTWVGNVIGAHPKVDNIIEPFNLNRINRYKIIDLDYWFPKVTERSEIGLQIKVRKLIKYYLNTNFFYLITNSYKSYEGHSILISNKKRLRRAWRPIKMIKDPIAVFSVPWLVKEFDLNPVILIRHPAAFALSIKDKNWWFDFDDFLRQPIFFSDGLESLKDEVIQYQKDIKEKDIVDNAALLWKIIYAQVGIYQEKNPEWYFITHETLSLNPIIEFQKLFEYLELPFTNQVKDYIQKSTKAKDHGKHFRDSLTNAIKWKKNLSQEEQQRIAKLTSPIYERFYNKF